MDIQTAQTQHAWQPSGFNIMAKAGGPICNLACEHCYYLSKAALYPDSDFRMSGKLLEEFTQQYIEAQRVPEVTFVWQGGEPTILGVEFYEKAIAFQKKYAKPGMQIKNSLQTNGTLITDEWAKFFKKHDFLIGISIDGTEDIHNRYRKYRSGKSSYSDVIRGLRYLQQYEVEYNALTCVSINNADRGLEVYRHFRDELGIEFIQFIPIVERENETGYQEGGKLTRRSCTPQQYANFLIAIYDEWIRHDIGKVFVQIFDTTLASWVGERPGLCVFEPTCGLGLVLEHNGDVFSCDHFVEPSHLLGNIKESSLVDLVFSKQQRDFGFAKKNTLTAYCKRCPWLFACHGGCPKNRVRKSPDGEEGQNYLCKAYEEFFSYVDKSMRAMANLIQAQRAPAELMQMVKENPNEYLPKRESQAAPKNRRRRH